jgi:hypothetical protein
MMEAKIAKKGPYVMDMQPGKYYWCSCGQPRLSRSAMAPTRSWAPA